MKTFFAKITILFLSLIIICCKQNNEIKINNSNDFVKYANGFTINKYNGFSILKVSNPWPKANKNYTYILKEEKGIIPDSLLNNTIISVPVKSIIVTSTTHIPSLEILNEEKTLIGFPNINYISSSKIRTLIDAKKVSEVGSNQNLNIEKIIDLNPAVIIGFGIDNNNPSLENLQKSGLKVVLNGDWNEQTPLGKAEWIKLFGALYSKEKQADSIFTAIESEYKSLVTLAKKVKTKPTILSGDIYENSWNLPQGNSWGCQILKQANTKYLWEETTGTGSLSLSIETVLERAKSAEFWLTSGQFSSLSEMQKANKHYTQFDAFKNKKVYSYKKNIGKNNGILFYELAPNRPDLVLKDLIKIAHPEILPNYQLTFYTKLE